MGLFDEEGNIVDRRGRQLPPPDPGPTITLPPTGQTAPPGAPGGEVPAFEWNPPAYTGPSRPQYNIGAPPQFRPPQFKGLSYEDAVNSPGFKFRLDAGREALEHSAAAKGASRTGGTLKEILEYGQKYGAEEYQNEWARALQGYDRDFNASLAAFSPQMAAWQAQLGAETGAGNLAFQRAFDLYQFPITEERLRQQMILDAQARALGSLS